jgi:hypothetical protein
VKITNEWQELKLTNFIGDVTTMSKYDVKCDGKIMSFECIDCLLESMYIGGDWEIRLKQQKQPIVKKSGQTWVCRANGEDYLFNFSNTEKPEFKDGSRWTNFKDVEINDELALLRPYVIPANLEDAYIIYACDNVYCLCNRGNLKNGYIVVFEKSEIRLATVEDL